MALEQAVIEEQEALKAETEQQEQATPARTVPDDSRAIERAELERELFAESSTPATPAEEQATPASESAGQETETSTPPGAESGETTGTEGTSTEAESEALDFASAFPAGLEIDLGDGKTVRVESAEDLIARIAASERKESKDRVEWDKSLHDRGRKLNQQQQEFIASQAKAEGERAELEELRQFKANLTSKSEIPALPPKPSRELIDPASDRYNPGEYDRLEAVRERTLEARTQKQIEQSLRKANEQPPPDPAAAIYGSAEAAEKQWYDETNRDLPADIKQEITDRSVPILTAMLGEIHEANKTRPPGTPMDVLRPRDVRMTLEQIKRELLAEKAAAKNTPTASTTGAQAFARSIRRAKIAPQASRQSAPAKSTIDPFDDTVSVEDFEKSMKSGKVKL